MPQSYPTLEQAYESVNEAWRLYQAGEGGADDFAYHGWIVQGYAQSKILGDPERPLIGSASAAPDNLTMGDHLESLKEFIEAEKNPDPAVVQAIPAFLIKAAVAALMKMLLERLAK